MASSHQLPDAVNIECWERPLWEYIQSVVGLVAGKRILDVGCGFGRESVVFAQKGAVVAGVDLSEKSIDRARELAQRMGVDVTYQVGNVDTVVYDEDYFDIVFCRAILHHLPDPIASLKRLSHFTRPGGLLIAQEPRLENPIAQIGRRFFNPSTVTEHPFRCRELETVFAEVCENVGVKNFFILSPASFAFARIGFLRRMQNPSFALLYQIDKCLFGERMSRKYSWIEIVHGFKPGAQRLSISPPGRRGE